MISIRIEKLTKRFGAVTALHGLDLVVEPGELFFLLGPSGCGKTTLLRCMAGFYVPEEGRIFFGDEDVTRLAPHKRNTGMMFQSYALWPHMTVAENVAFGLEERKLPRAEIRTKVGEALESVHMGAYAERRPNQLSGGQQQRVALARALVIRPRCLLLDEPLSNLDARLRLEMRMEIRRVCKEFKLTTVYVTHDQKEALSVADRIAVLKDGKVAQVGTPADLYHRPNSAFVAGFIGQTNLLTGRVTGRENGTLRIDTAAGPVVAAATADTPAGDAVVLSIRPEQMRVARDGAAPGVKRFAGRTAETIFLGEASEHVLTVNEQKLKVISTPPLFAPPAEMAVEFDPRDVVVLAG